MSCGVGYGNTLVVVADLVTLSDVNIQSQPQLLPPSSDCAQKFGIYPLAGSSDAQVLCFADEIKAIARKRLGYQSP